MKWAIVAFGMLAASPAMAQFYPPQAPWFTPLPPVQGAGPIRPMQVPQLYEPPYGGPQFHNYTFPNGSSMNCTTLNPNSVSPSTMCN
jgi:hypothetical protein